MNKELKIAIYSGEIPSTTFIENLINGVALGGNKIFLFGKLKVNTSYENKNVKIYATPSDSFSNVYITFFRSLLLLLKFQKRFFVLFKVLSKHKSFYAKWQWWSRYVPVAIYLPDIFHVQWAKDIEHWFFLKEKFNCKIVLSLLGSHINYSPVANEKLALLYKQLFPEIDAFHSVSKAIGLEAQNYGASSKKIRLIHSPIKNDVFKKFRNLENRINNPLKIVSVGRHHWIKGYNYGVSAMRLLKDRGIDFEYSLIAQGEVPESLLFQVNEMDIQNDISFLNGIGQEQLFNEIQKFDVLLLPSLNEGIANVVLEAMALGILVISTNCGGMSEVIKPGKTGWLVPVRNPEAIANALVEVRDCSLEKRQKIVNNAHCLVKEQFNSELIIKEFNEFYEGAYYN